MTETLISCIVSFIGTNIDDIFINTLFFSEANSRKELRAIVGGNYLGIGALVLISVLGAFGLQFFPSRYIGVLGLIPIGLGIKEVIGHRRKKRGEEEQAPPKKAKGFVLNVMLVSIANGADNIGVYLPLFAGFSPWQLITAIGVFAGMIALWCFLGKKLSDLPSLRRLLVKYKGILVPAVYIAPGIYILLKP